MFTSVGLPALRQGRALVLIDAAAARVQACFALIAAVGDTNLLHRGGRAKARDTRLMPPPPFFVDGGVGAPDWRDARRARAHRIR